MSSWLTLRLLGAHVLERADDLAEAREHRLFGQRLADGLGHAEVDHLGHRLARRIRATRMFVGLMSRWMIPF